MTSKLLVAIVGLLLIIPNNGHPTPEKDTLNENKENSKTESTSTEKPTDVTSNSNDVSQSTTSKPKEQPKESQTKKMSSTTTPEPDDEEDEDQVYFMLPKREKSNFSPLQPFYFNPRGIQTQPKQPQFMFNQPPMQMPFSYPMMFQPMLNPQRSMKTNDYIDFDLPLGMFDGSTMLSIPQTHRQSFGMNTNHRNNRHMSSSMPRAHSWYGGMVDPIYSKQIANHYL